MVTVAPTGTIAGVVEKETSAGGPVEGPDNQPKGHPGTLGRRPAAKKIRSRCPGARLSLAPPGVDLGSGARARVPKRRPALVGVGRRHRTGPRPQARFRNTGQAAPAFGTELDLVEGTGDVVLYRFLGQGFANVPGAGGLVTYVPGWTEQRGPANAYDQTLIGYSSGSWRVFSEQYVPDSSALRQHRARVLGQPGRAGQIIRPARRGLASVTT